MMRGWPKKPLGELVMPTEQRDPRDTPSEEFLYVDIASVDNNFKVVAGAKKLLGADAPSRARKVIRKGDVIVSTVRPNLNAVALVPSSLDNQICSTGFSVLRPSKNVLSRYLFAFVRSPLFIDALVARTTGANYPAVNDGEVKEVQVPVPPLAEQKRLIALLDEADELRKLRVKADSRAVNFILALFQEMFGDGQSFPTKPLIELVDADRGISYGVVQRGNQFPGGVPLLRISDFGHNFVDPRNLVLVDPEISAQYRRTVLVGGELVVSIRGTVGRVAIVPPEAKGWNVAREVGVIPLLPGVSRPFLHTYMLSSFAQTFMTNEVRGIAQRGINLEDLRRLPIPIPPLLLQQEFAQRVEEFRELESAQAASRQRLDDLFQSMLHRAFNGEL
jgi:type I restriction enzyme S subunit